MSAQVFNDFKNAFRALITFNSFTDAAKWDIYQLLKDPKYSKLNDRELEDFTFIGKSTINRGKKGKLSITDPKKNKVAPSPVNQEGEGSQQQNDGSGEQAKVIGRPKKMLGEDEDYVMLESSHERHKSHAVSIKWATDLSNVRLAGRTTVSRFTIRRLFKARGWKKRKSVRKQGYCLTENYHYVIHNWRYRMKEVMKKNPNSTVHVMDESGIHTNLLPRYTMVEPGDKFANVDTHPDTTKDTVVVTLSSTGAGDLFYVPYRRATKNRKGCSGVGIEEMRKWVAHFLSYAQKGDILLMDNLAAHHEPSILKTLTDAGIIVRYFPVRAASKLSPLDNCFFAILKYHLQHRFSELIGLSGIQLRIQKRLIINQEFDKLIQRGVGLSYFRHCKYNEMNVNLGADQTALHDAIPFPFDDDDSDEDGAYVQTENDEDKDTSDEEETEGEAATMLPKIRTPGITKIYANALAAIILVNKSIKELLLGSNDEFIKTIATTLGDKEGQKTVTASRMYAALPDVWTLPQYIEKINTLTNNMLKYINRDKHIEEEKGIIFVGNNGPMPKLLTSYTVTQAPQLLTLMINDKEVRHETFSFPEIVYCSSTHGRIIYKLTGFIGYKGKETYFSVSEVGGKWMKYSKRWDTIIPYSIEDYYIDSVDGCASMLFYKNISNSNERDDILQTIVFDDAATEGQLQQIITECPIDLTDMPTLTYEKRLMQRARSTDTESSRAMPIIGMINGSTLCHLNTNCQMLFQIKDFVTYTNKLSQTRKSPAVELNIIFEELGKPGGPVEPRNLLHALGLEEGKGYNVEETLGLLLKKIFHIQNEGDENIFSFFSPTDPIGDSIESCVLRSDEDDINIELAVGRLYNLNHLKRLPPVLIVEIIRADHDRKEVPAEFNICIDGKSVDYELFTITAFAPEHYMQFIKTDNEEWYGIDDADVARVEIKQIEALFGSDEDQNRLYSRFNKPWVGTHAFYRYAK